jgi:GDSL-like Lipase/Acylhydrolase family
MKSKPSGIETVGSSNWKRVWLKELLFGLVLTVASLAFVLTVLEFGGRVFGFFPPPSGAYRFSRTKGYELSPGQGDVNSEGFRDHEYQLTKPEHTFRIVAVGDSFTFGAGVKPEETYSKRLEAMLNEQFGGKSMRFEVLNTGVPGYNTHQELIHLQELGLRFEPDLIVVGFTMSDAELGDLGLKDAKERERLIRFKEWLKNHFGLYGFLRLRMKRLVDWFNSASLDPNNIGGSAVIPLRLAANGKSSPGWNLCRESLGEIAVLGRTHRCPIMLVIFPFLDRLDDTYPFTAEHALVAKTGRENQMVVLDLFPAFRGLQPPKLWVTPTDSHPNSHGHLIAAECIFKTVLASGLIPSLAGSDEGLVPKAGSTRRH